MKHPDPSGMAKPQPTFGQRREAEHLAGYVESLLQEGKRTFYSQTHPSDYFSWFTAELEKPRSINNLAGGHPADYRLVLRRESRLPYGAGSARSSDALAFDQWFREVYDRLQAYGADAGDFSTDSRLSRIVLNFKTDNPAAIAALDGLISQHEAKQAMMR